MRADFLADHHVVSGLYPKADAFDTSMTSDYISLRDYRRLSFFIHTGNITSDTANGTVTVLAATDASGTNATAVAFRYRKCLSSTTVDVWSALTAGAAAGFSMTAADNVLYEVEVDASEMEAALAGGLFIALKVTEVTNDPVVAGVIAILSEPRYGVGIPATAIA